MCKSYLPSILKQFQYNKSLGEQTFAQLSKEQLFWQSDEEANSIATIVKHISGNMLSRLTNFLNEDGEKPWRKRDDEFINSYETRQDILKNWDQGWTCLFKALENVNDHNLESIVYVRNEGHTVIEVINRQLSHYSYHIGQIVLLGRLIKKEQWSSLSIPKGQSEEYNKEKFAKNKRRTHFTDDL